MRSKLSCSPLAPARRTDLATLLISIICSVVLAAPAHAGDAPQWMHAVAGAALPAHDEKTDAVLLYSETNVNVISTEKIKTVERRAYKILRPDGREYGDVVIPFRSPGVKISNLHGWCIPAQGKDYEVKDKDALDAALPKIDGSELISDVRVKVLQIPASDPGNIVGYEYEKEEEPLVLEDEWYVQEESPDVQSSYSLQLPPGWGYKSVWLNHPDVQPTQAGNNLWQWTVSNVKGVRQEDEMPPMKGVLAKMVVSFFPRGGPGQKGYANWQQMGLWYLRLTSERITPSPELKQKVVELTSRIPSTVDKMRALAKFVQEDIRYVAIELGIGGFQPHAATDVFAHRYGDCKDKATLLISMLREIGVESYYVVINDERGSVTSETPAYNAFNHVIVAIKLPSNADQPWLAATFNHPKLGRILFFDPTNEATPFGEIGGYLQANYGLLVSAGGGELVELPKLPSAMNSVHRTAKLSLDTMGNLQGSVEEIRVGDRAWSQRMALRRVTKNTDRIKPIENILAGSLSNFHITKASITNLQAFDQPFGFNYSFEAINYAKNAGSLLLVRPRVIGVKASGILETKEPRLFPVEFEGPVQDIDDFEIILPQGYVVDDLPPPVDADFGFASYHSKTEVKGNVLDYSRTFEVKELSVPVSKTEELKKFYRIIATDERNTAVLKPTQQ